MVRGGQRGQQPHCVVRAGLYCGATTLSLGRTTSRGGPAGLVQTAEARGVAQRRGGLLRGEAERRGWGGGGAVAHAELRGEVLCGGVLARKRGGICDAGGVEGSGEQRALDGRAAAPDTDS